MATSLALAGVVRKLEGEVRGRKTLFFWKVSPEKGEGKGGGCLALTFPAVGTGSGN